MAVISVSILDIDMKNLDGSLWELKEAGTTHIHVDIIDTSFAPNISFGPSTINQILKYDFHFDLHLMINDPLCILKQLDLERVWLVAVHSHLDEVCEFIRDVALVDSRRDRCECTSAVNKHMHGRKNYPDDEILHKGLNKLGKPVGNPSGSCMVGLAVNPEESVHESRAECLLIMTVQAGFGGQAFRRECIEKIQKAKQMRKFVGVDGGINEENIKLIKDADLIIVGSALTKSTNLKEKFKMLRELVNG